MHRVIVPALFKVDANDCSVALLGSTPRVSENSLEGCLGQHVLFQTTFKSNEWGGSKGVHSESAHLLAMSMVRLSMAWSRVKNDVGIE